VYDERVDARTVPAATPEEPEWDAQRLDALRSALEQLPEKQSIIVRLRLQGKTLNDIAAITKRPLGTIAVENSRALSKLRSAVPLELAKIEGRT
jgi:RNA polymerase sigma factor (sigma-70 family)